MRVLLFSLLIVFYYLSRIIKQAVQGLVCMWGVNSNMQAAILQKLIQVVQDSQGYRYSLVHFFNSFVHFTIITDLLLLSRLLLFSFIHQVHMYGSIH